MEGGGLHEGIRDDTRGATGAGTRADRGGDLRGGVYEALYAEGARLTPAEAVALLAPRPEDGDQEPSHDASDGEPSRDASAPAPSRDAVTPASSRPLNDS